jgi:hypothetical protein
MVCRYNLFFILYPIGISSEMWLVYSSIPAASKQNPLYGYGLWAILGIYVPGESACPPCGVHPRPIAGLRRDMVRHEANRLLRTIRVVHLVHAYDGPASPNNARKAACERLMGHATRAARRMRPI